MDTSSNTSTASSSFGSKREQLPFLRKSLVSRLRLTLWHFWGYVFSTLPIIPFLPKFCSVITLIQLVVPSMVLADEILYPKNTLIHSVAQVLSISTRLIPVGSPTVWFRILGWILLAFSIINGLITGFSTYHFSKKSELPTIILHYINIYTILFSPIIMPFSISCATIIITMEERHIYDIVLSCLIYISYLVTAIYDFLKYLESLFFFPIPFATFKLSPHATMNAIIPLLTVLSELNHVNLFPYSGYVLPLVMIIFYVILYFHMTYIGIIINSTEYNAFSAAIITAVLICTSSFTFCVLEREIPLFCPLLYLALWLIWYFVFNIIHKKTARKKLSLLNTLEQNSEEISKIKSEMNLVHTIIYGCITGHPYCISYNIFHDAIEKFPDSYILLVCFAKFLAIYPEESHQLIWVLMRLKKIKCRKNLKKYIMTQVNVLMMRRDSSLSPELKKKIQSLSQLIVIAKLRIRNAWEAAISGSSSKLYPSFARATNIIEEINLKFVNLRSYHGNNQYALSLQASYTKDVLAGYQEAANLKELVRLAQAGRLSSIDQPFIFGRYCFPNLPLKLSKTPTQLAMTDVQIHTSQEDIYYRDDETLNDGSSETIGIHSQLKTAIDSIRIPSIHCSLIFIVVCVVLFNLIPFIVVVSMTGQISTLISDPSKYLTAVTQIRSRSYMAFSYLTLYRIELIDHVKLKCYTKEPISESIGGACNTRGILLHFANIAIESLSSLKELQLSDTINDHLQSAQHNFFLQNQNYKEYKDWYNFVDYQRTVYQEIVNLLETSLMLSSENETLIDPYSRLFANVIQNCFQLSRNTQYVIQQLTRFLEYRISDIKSDLVAIQLSLTVIIPIINVAIIVICSFWLVSDQNKVYRCFTALPKSTLYNMMAKLDLITRTSVMNQQPSRQISQLTSTDDIQDKKAEDDRIIALFHTSQNGIFNKNIVFSVIACIVLTINEGVMIYLLPSLFKSGSDIFIKSTPHMNTITTTIVNIHELAISLTMYANQNYFFGELIEDLNETFDSTFQSALNSFHVFYFGNASDNSDPIIATTKNIFTSLLKQPNFSITSTDISDLYTCLPYDLMFYYLMELIRQLYITTYHINRTLDPSNEILTHIWNMITIQLYPNFFKPLYWSYMSEVYNLVVDQILLYYLITAFLAVFTVILGLYVVTILLKTRRQLISVIKLLLHAPPKIVLQSRYIMAIVSGDFNTHDDQSLTSLDESSLKRVLADFPGGIVKLDKDGNILESNKSGEYLIEGIDKFDPSLECQILEINGKTLNIIHVVQEDSVYALINDRTKENRLKKEIQKEEEKRRKLLNIILPKIVLNDYSETTHGNNAAFQSQTVTSLSIEIQSIHEIDYTKIFKFLKSLQNVYPSVGYVDIDFYRFVAISGVSGTRFTEEAAAYQLIQFAVDAISFCKTEVKCDKKGDVTVQAGVVTGGPVTGGVILMNKVPQFEIFGDVIDYSKSMAQLAPNFSVHLSRSTYEYVYGINFDIREVGEIKVPLLGNIVTYVIQL